MIIQKIEIVNFRGFHEIKINFEDKPVVLLVAANGIGKTTIIDAIEWCLTGDIKRLRDAFDSRSTNQDERKINTGGILKNKNAGAKDQVQVTLCLFDGQKELSLRRVQEKDELDPKSSTVTLDGDENVALEFIREYVGDSFYNFHFCDVQKTFNVQSKKRKDLKDLFSEFITNYDEQRMVAANLDLFVEDVERYILDKTGQKVAKELIEDREKQLARAREEARQVAYPPVVFYPDEKIEITELTKDELIAQKAEVKNCGYQIVTETLSKMLKNENLKTRKAILEELDVYWKTKPETVQRAVKVGLWKNTDAITNLKMKRRTLQTLSMKKDTIFQDGESVIALGIKGIEKSELDEEKQTITEKEKKVKGLDSDIKLLSSNNKILELLSSLSVKKQLVMEYRDHELEKKGYVRCPVCGSETFATMEASQILREADEYIRQNGEAVRTKEAEKTSLQEEINMLYQKIIDYIISAVEKEKEVLDSEIQSLTALKDEIYPYFDKLKRLQETGQVINVEELTSAKINELLAITEQALLNKNVERTLAETYQRILKATGYAYEEETVQQTYEKVKNLITTLHTVTNFSYDIFVSKINAIDSVLANQTLTDLMQKLEANYKKNQTLDGEIEELQKLKGIAHQRAQDIRTTVESLSKDEYEKVGPALTKFYNKLARLDLDDAIHIVQENEGLSIVDGKGKNIVNVLSNGQISVFMLAHFFAGINARNASEKMKVYFIDDLTACMDDVNMLAFMDLLKYQLSSKATMEQLFFSTCDERINKLLQYKLKGRDIDICEISEEELCEAM